MAARKFREYAASASGSAQQLADVAELVRARKGGSLACLALAKVRGQGRGVGLRRAGVLAAVLLLRRRARLAQGQCEGQECPLEWIRRVVGPAPSTAECATPYRSVFVGTIFNCPGAANGSAPQRQRALSERASNSC